VRDPFVLDPDAEFVAIVREAAAATCGSQPALAGASFWADSGYIAAAGIPTVLFGPSGAGAHAPEEWVSIGETELVARTLVEIAARFCA
jgi:acetylornithine deacetylase